MDTNLFCPGAQTAINVINIVRIGIFSQNLVAQPKI